MIFRLFVRSVLSLAVCVLASISSQAADLYISSFGSNTAGKYDSATGGSPVGGWTNPNVPGATAIAADSSGNVYIASSNSGWVRKYDSSGTQVPGWEISVSNVQGIAINESLGRMYVTRGAQGLVASYNLSDRSVVNPNLIGSAIGNPYGITVDALGYVYVAAESTGIIYKVDGATGANAPGWTNQSGLNSPTGLALDSVGNLYASSYNGGFVSKFNGGTGASMTFTSPQYLGSFLPGPQGIAIDSQDQLYVTLNNAPTVAKYDLLNNSQPSAGWSYPTGLAGGVGVAIVPVPEPSTYALAGLSAIALVVVAHQRRRNDLKAAV